MPKLTTGVAGQEPFHLSSNCSLFNESLDRAFLTTSPFERKHRIRMHWRHKHASPSYDVVGVHCPVTTRFVCQPENSTQGEEVLDAGN